MLWYVFPLFMTALGLLYPNRDTWFESLRDLFVFLAIHYLVTSTVWEILSPILARPRYERLQAKKTDNPLYLEEIRDSLATMYIIATLSAWPLAMQRDGYPNAFKKNIGEAAFFDSYVFYGLNMGYVYYFAKIFVTSMWADAWTFWKHYSFHHPSVYAIHKGHHVHHNPSTFAGFALHPIEAFGTFCPILAMCVP